ncbi:MAG: LL-diaminopimelate aminotransferase [Firmicutes bacterium]|jgi:LL-diaminopimelate aminotransferase|nr:LL-diaminopimelate aminotransferase [Bacillota bacterium]
MKTAARLQNLAPYLFAQIELKVERARQAGQDIISLGIGDPDMPTPGHVVEEAQTQVANAANHQYPSSRGMRVFREAVCRYYSRRHGVSLDPDSEVVTLIGSKEGVGHISFCFTDPGRANLVPNPGYPVYSAGTLLAGGEVADLPLLPERGYLPDFSAIPSDVARNTAIMFLNYPNNPTGSVATAQTFMDAVEFARGHDILLCHDAAYTEIAYDGERPPSLLEFPGARDVGIEFGSLSKIFNMTGWRIAWAVGNADAIRALATLKSNLDSGVFQAIQLAAVRALDGPWEPVRRMVDIYRRRRDVVIDALHSMGWSVEPPRGSIYVWAPVPEGLTSIEFAEGVFDRAGVVVAPGIGYGTRGEGYFRISLTVPDDRLKVALDRMKGSGVCASCGWR